MSASTTLLPFQPATMSTAQVAAVSFLARYSGRTHTLYPFQLKLWFGAFGGAASDGPMACVTSPGRTLREAGPDQLSAVDRVVGTAPAVPRLASARVVSRCARKAVLLWVREGDLGSVEVVAGGGTSGRCADDGE